MRSNIENGVSRFYKKSHDFDVSGFPSSPIFDEVWDSFILIINYDINIWIDGGDESLSFWNEYVLI